MAELDEVSRRLHKLLQLLPAQRGPRGRGHRRRRDRSPAASSAGLRKDSGKASEGPAAGAESEPLHGQPPGITAGALVILAPGEADGSLLTAPGEIFASLAVSVMRAHLIATVRRHLRTAKAWVRLRELVRKAANRRFDCLGFGLWFHALVYHRRRLAGDDEQGILVRLQHPEKMGSEWGFDIIVFRSETVGSCKAYALALLARCWTSASVRKEAIEGHKLMVTSGGQDVALDHSRTLAQSGILAGSTIKLKSTGLLGGGGGQTKLWTKQRQVAQHSSPAASSTVASGTLAQESDPAASSGFRQVRGLSLRTLLRAAASGASSPPDHRAVPPAIPHALMLVLSCLDDAGLRREFDAHADLAALAASAEDKGERRMSKAGLASFMGAKGLKHGDAEVEQVMKRVDTNGDFEIDFLEFCALARVNSDLELVLRSQRLECVLASFFPSGTKFEDLGKMDHTQFSAIVNLSQPAMVQLLVGLAAQVAAVGKAQECAGGSKFSGELKGGPLDTFYEGVTGVCGEPDADIEKGMREEHTMLPGSDVEFSTSNYGLTTTPSKEWALVLEGGSRCDKAEGKEGSVSVTGTRGCCKVSGLKWLNTGNADPTALGSKWKSVGDTQPTEGRQLTNSMLADALASSTTKTARWMKVFHDLDRDRDGTLSRWEFTPFAMALGAPEEEDVQWLFSQFDTGSKGVISESEFLAVYRKFIGGDLDVPSEEAQSWLDELFKKLKDQISHVVDFTKEDLDKFGITDLRSTDFIKADGSYFKPIASSAEILANPRLADALMHKTEFTQQEWDAFGVYGLRMHHFVKSGDSYFNPAGETQPDLRVLRPIAFYGDFGDDGRLKDLLPNALDTPIQRRVKQARLRRCDVLALILYTGVFEYLCGCVPRERMQSLSLSTASCRFPSGQSMMIPAQANHYHPRALTTRTPPIFRADVHPLQRAPARLWLLRRGGGGHRVCIGRVLGAVERGRH